MSRPPVARPNTLRISVSDLTNQTVEIKSLYPNQVALVVFSLIARGHGNLNSRMLVIQPGRWNSRDEELRTVRPRTGVGHGQFGASARMSSDQGKLGVGGKCTYEFPDDTME
jgi:hypothetical protein